MLLIRAWNAHMKGTDSRNTCSSVRREIFILFFFIFLISECSISLLEALVLILVFWKNPGMANAVLVVI